MSRAWLKKAGESGLYLLLSLFLGGASPAAETIPRIEASLDQERIRVGEEAALSVEVTWEGDASGLVFLPPDRPAGRLVTVTGSSQKSLVCRTGDRLRQVRRYIFRLKGEEKGDGQVGGVRVLYHRRGEEQEHSLESGPLSITVTSQPGNIVPVAVILIAIASAGYIFQAVKRRKKK